MPISSFSISKKWVTNIINKNTNKYCSVEVDSSDRNMETAEKQLNTVLTPLCMPFKEYACFFRRRVMVVVDETKYSKHAMMFALSHVVNKGDLLTLLLIVPLVNGGGCYSCSPLLVHSLASLCKVFKPQVEVEALVVQGPKLSTIISQIKKLEISVLVIGQRKLSPFLNCLGRSSRSEKVVEECIDNVECTTIGVRKQSKGVGGYLITTKWLKNFWLLA